MLSTTGKNDKELKSETSLHHSTGKPPVEQLPPQVLLEVARAFISNKYPPRNWTIGNDWGEYYGSAQRHLQYWWNSETFDEESGLNHLSHAIANLMILYYYQLNNLGKDNRFNGPLEA